MRDIYYKETKCLRENCLFYIGTGIRYRKYRESSARALRDHYLSRKQHLTL